MESLNVFRQQFKIDESGLINGTIGDGYWGDGKMIAQNSSWTTTIPKTVPSGNYLIRFETIALHSLPAVRETLFIYSGFYAHRLGWRSFLDCSNSTLSAHRF